MRKFFLTLFVMLAVSIGNSIHADLINLTGQNVIWNRFSQPAGSPNVTLSVQNGSDNDAGSDDFFGYSLGLKLVPQLGATGTLTIANIVNASGNVFASPAGAPVVNFEPGYTGIANQNGPALDANVSAAGLGLVTFNFTSANAVGVFNLVADYTLSSYNDVDANEFTYANASAADVVLGTVTVTAIPEPGTWMIMGMAGLAIGRAGWRKKKTLLQAST